MKPVCQLVGNDGNVFSVIASVVRALEKADMKAEAEVFRKKAFLAESYDEVLRLSMEYVEVE